MLPKALYFDTNALRQLTGGISNIDFIELRDMSKEIGVIFYAPEIVVKEWVQWRTTDALDQMRTLDKASQTLGRILGREALSYEKPKDVEETVINIMYDYLNSAEIRMITTPNIPLDGLVNMAVRKEPPFEMKGEKGFRDSIILFTIIEHMKRSGFQNAVLVSGDSIFMSKEILDRFWNEGLEISIAKNIGEAKQQIKSGISEAIKFRVEEKAKTTKAFLDSKFDMISSYLIQNAQITESSLRGGMFSQEPDLLGMHIRKILTARPKEISKVYPGLTLTKEPIEEGSEAATFIVSTEFDLVVERFGQDLITGPKVSLAALEEFEKLRYTLPSPSGEQEQKTVTRKIMLEAVILMEEGSYTQIQRLKVLTS